MALKNIKKNSGFTIVELLIVIVVIAILATITIVAYNGIQNRAKASAGKSTANAMIKKLEAYNAVNNAYPTTVNQIQGTAESKIDGLPASGTASTKPLYYTATTGTIFDAGPLDATKANGGASVRVSGSATGGQVYYWDYSNGSGAEASVSYGAGS